MRCGQERPWWSDAEGLVVDEKNNPCALAKEGLVKCALLPFNAPLVHDKFLRRSQSFRVGRPGSNGLSPTYIPTHKMSSCLCLIIHVL